MKFAYISLQEPYSLGVRIAQVQDTTDGLVDVPGYFFWTNCDDDVTPPYYYYDVSDNNIKPVPTP